ncbi:restriction endonuclease subunit S [Alteromonas sp. A081]|uniref:restriction endonuclease subunit S n=1 Tax=Alteromonas sp. A081 TaxID=3410269 RepID=UPI003B9827A2
MQNTNAPSTRFKVFSNPWATKVVSEISTKVTDGTHDTPKVRESGVPYLTAIHVKDGKIDFANCYYVSEEEHQIIFKRCNPERDDILLVNIGAGTATAALVDVDFEFSLKNVALIKPNRDVVNPVFLEQSLRMQTRKLFHQLTSGGAQPFLSLKQINKLKISICDIEEQQKIADFLTVVDKKISLLKEKHALLEQYKKGVMQQLFKREIRFKDDDGSEFPDWQETKLGTWLEEYKEKSQIENQYEVLTSSRKGLIKQSDYYGEGRITERKNLGFNVIPSGFLTYRSRSDDRQFFFNKNDLGFTGIISTYYPVFTMKNKQNDFFVELTRMHKNKFGRQAVGTSQVVLSFNELKNIKLPMPSSKEQEKITNFSLELDTKLRLLKEQIELIQTFKKGLMQKMFV